MKPYPKVLIVDNDPGIGRLLRILLEGEGYKVLWSRNGESVNGFSLELTATEGAVLHILARHAGKLVLWQRITRAIGGTIASPKLAELRVYIAGLRRKLEERGGSNLIRGDGSLGYSLLLETDHEYSAPKTVF